MNNEYSSPRLVEDWMEEPIVGLLLVENWGQLAQSATAPLFFLPGQEEY